MPSIVEHLFIDGRILPADQASIPATDRAIHYGYGLFEALRTYGGTPFRLDDHMARLRRSAKRFALPCPYTGRSLAPWIARLLARNRLDDAFVRITLTAGDGRRRGSIIIRTLPLPAIPRAWRVEGAPIRIATWLHDPDAPLYGHKTLNYLENLLVREENRRLGYADTIFIAPDKRLLEGTKSNIFLVKAGRLVTPESRGILPGVTRKVVLEIAARLGVRVWERPTYAGELYTAQEVFLTGSVSEVLPVGRLGTRRLKGPGALTRRIAEAYREITAKAAAAPRARPRPGAPSGP